MKTEEEIKKVLKQYKKEPKLYEDWIKVLEWILE